MEKPFKKYAVAMVIYSGFALLAVFLVTFVPLAVELLGDAFGQIMLPVAMIIGGVFTVFIIPIFVLSVLCLNEKHQKKSIYIAIIVLSALTGLFVNLILAAISLYGLKKEGQSAVAV